MMSIAACGASALLVLIIEKCEAKGLYRSLLKKLLGYTGQKVVARPVVTAFVITYCAKSSTRFAIVGKKNRGQRSRGDCSSEHGDCFCGICHVFMHAKISKHRCEPLATQNTQAAACGAS
jgi:hypothetical protein